MKFTMPDQLSKLWKIAICWGLGLLMVLSIATPSQAHWADLAVADIQIKSQDIDLNLTIPTGLISQFDDDKNQQLSDAEITIHQQNLQTFFNDKIRLTAAGQKQDKLIIKPTIATSISANLVAAPKTHSSLLLQYHWSAPIDQLQMHYQLFVPGVNTARCLAQILRDGRVDNLVFTPDTPTAALIDAPIFQQISSFIRLGIEHIWTGYDHILFLISLLMLGGKLRYLLKVVTAFSLSHSVTLCLAALNMISIPSRWVEIAIALSIGYVAAENLRRQPPLARWQLAFGFGLIHGLGFSSALQELDLPRNNLVTSLASFSVGIELGQFAIVLAIYFALTYLHKCPWDRTMRQIMSIGVMVMSAIWLCERIFTG
jgi:hydrogenase/urease accessory protein HupE